MAVACDCRFKTQRNGRNALSTYSLHYHATHPSKVQSKLRKANGGPWRVTRCAIHLFAAETSVWSSSRIKVARAQPSAWTGISKRDPPPTAIRATFALFYKVSATTSPGLAGSVRSREMSISWSWIFGERGDRRRSAESRSVSTQTRSTSLSVRLFAHMRLNEG